MQKMPFFLSIAKNKRVCLLIFWMFSIPQVVHAENKKPTQQQAALGNQKNQSFNKAKKTLQKEIYKDHQETFYCGCSYSEKKINYKGCSYKPQNPHKKRAQRVEWEHIVPAQHFGQSFKEWREGHKNCVDSKGKKFKGRNCARKMAHQFRYMEADLYNLVPAIGEVNQIRSNLKIGVAGKEKNRLQGSCQTIITDSLVEPRDEVKGFVARVYKYMNHAYPQAGIISNKNEPLIELWDKKFPPSAWEIERARRIEKIQGNSNPFVMPNKI